MDYFLVFLEGFASFVSPCILPMIPIYIAYFAGDKEKGMKNTVWNAISFVCGFTLVFVIMSILASFLGDKLGAITQHCKILFGILMILLGLSYMNLLPINLFKGKKTINFDVKNLNILKSFLFGVIFSISWTPCIGTFLSAALLLIAKSQNIGKGIVLILLYSLGLGIPFIVSSVLIDRMKSLFQFIKKHFDVVRKVSGVILIVMGIYTFLG